MEWSGGWLGLGGLGWGLRGLKTFCLGGMGVQRFFLGRWGIGVGEFCKQKTGLMIRKNLRSFFLVFLSLGWLGRVGWGGFGCARNSEFGVARWWHSSSNDFAGADLPCTWCFLVTF